MSSDDRPLIRGACSSDISVPTLWGENKASRSHYLFQHKPLNCLFGIIWPEIHFFMPSYWELVGTVSIKQAMRIVVQLLHHVWLFATPWTAAHQARLSSTISQCLLNSCPLSQLPNHLSLCHPLLLSPSSFPSIRVFSSELALCIRWSKYWSFSFRTSPSNEYSGLFPLGLTTLISLLSKGLSRVLSNTTIWSRRFFGAQPSLRSLTSIHDSWKNRSFDYTELGWTVYQKNLTFTSNSMIYRNF